MSEATTGSAGNEGEQAGVIVVGAGLAGLITASRLEQAGVSTIVLEATNQVGGRTRGELVGSQLLDVGGQLVGTDYRQLRRLASNLGLHLDPDAALPRLRLHPEVRPAVTPANLAGLNRLARQVRRWCADLPPAAPWQAPQAARLDDISVAEWLATSAISARTARLLERLIGAFALATPERLSLLHLLVWLAPAGGLRGVWRETRWSIREGAQELSRRLAARLSTPPLTALTEVPHSCYINFPR